MFHQGARTTNSELSSDQELKVDQLLNDFAKKVAEKVEAAKLRRAVVRSMLQCSIINVLDSHHLFVAAQKTMGMPSTLSLYHPHREFSIQDIYEAARWDFGFDDPFVIQFSSDALEQQNTQRWLILEAIADEHIRSEVARVEKEMNLIQVNPIFGAPSYTIDQQLVFVLMPFQTELTAIYNAFIKPTIEDDSFRLVCRRADDIKSNRAIIQDIWKSICEARLIIADLSGLNANVMYELGIAHTLGKETILIYQQGENVKFPFDLAHIRRIQYRNDAMGGKQLVDELRATVKAVLSPVSMS